jgi:hypothetical protein
MRTIRVLASIAAICVSSVAAAQPPAERSLWPPEPAIVGDWSEPANQLRGRLLFGETVNSAGIRLGVLYLELQNLKRVDADLYYVFIPATGGQRGGANAPIEASFSSLHCVVQDKLGTTWELRGASGYRGNMPSQPRWLFLPRGATLRFPVSMNGYSWPADTELGFGVGMGEGKSWVIPKGADPDNYVLAATLTIRPPADREGHVGAWEGKLTLPAIKLPVAKAAAVPPDAATAPRR